LSRGNERKDVFHDDRGFRVYPVWKTCMLPNKETGRVLGMIYRAVSHILSSMRISVETEMDLRSQYNRICSLCEM
jgi:hypothetical protein